MTLTKTQERRYNLDARPYRVIWGMLIICAILRCFNLDPLDGLHALLPLWAFRFLVCVLLYWLVLSLFKATVRRIIQEELVDYTPSTPVKQESGARVISPCESDTLSCLRC
jgi:choline-glycine betaine transporter